MWGKIQNSFLEVNFIDRPALSWDGKYLAKRDRYQIEFWDTETNQLVETTYALYPGNLIWAPGQYRLVYEADSTPVGFFSGRDEESNLYYWEVGQK